MYKDERKNRKAAANPSQREQPFSMDDHYKGPRMAKNDPVGREEYKANPYGVDKRLNWGDRS